MRVTIQPKIKICGVRTTSAVRLLNRHQPDFAGFIFYRKSPRFVSMTEARALSQNLNPAIVPVGVFVREDVDRIIHTCRALRTVHAQVHGARKSEILKLKRAGLRVIEAHHVQKRADWKAVRSSDADFVLVDNRAVKGGRSSEGGTGETFNWSLAPKSPIKGLILAGGLTVDNYQQGVELFQPAVLDFNSGVESSPGVKSAKKLKELFDSLQS